MIFVDEQALHQDDMVQRKGPFRLVTVNTAPERAQRLISRLVEALKEEYEIVHVDNCQSTPQSRSINRQH